MTTERTYLIPMPSIRKILLLLVLSLGFLSVAQGQAIKNSSYQTVAHIKSDGTIQDASYRTIGHASGIPMEWAAFFFFFHK